MASSSRHVYHLESSEPSFSSPLGSIRKCTVDELPILKAMSLKRLTLQPKGIREPHWHADSNELTYCLSGNALVNIIDTHSNFASFTIKAGQMFHIPSGSLHHIENISDDEPAEFLVCFRHEKPEDFSLSAAYGAMSPAFLGTQNKEIVERGGVPTIPDTAHHQDVHKFDVEGQQPPLQGEDIRSARLAKSIYWPALENVAMYSLRVEDKAMREPHWHPITAELGYVDKGQARMTILDPSGETDTYTLGPGDMYFILAAYPHQIEVLPEGGKEIHFCIFFDQPMPLDIGYKASAEGMPHEAMAATLGIKRREMPKMEGTSRAPHIVPRINDVDEVKVWTK
ncbi:uncharacterized protein LTR77_007155 [Saxophila tyrrhenica]|uniref:Cupin type-1 domain-containing protein n=1 Tax=Saxophila tyrrhenica TaxID=1690608 RepID=A0AAV9P3X4_9PEZI|nr:hypothetical protein LTR77_007155 [Saxophila tyrrhenica]